MEDTPRFDLMVQAFAEVIEEQRTRSHLTAPTPVLPSLASVIAETSPIPGGALFLGMADDELPVLLNLYDPIAGPLLIIADEQSGKTAFLKMTARAIELMHSPSNVQYCIVTRRPNDWKSFKDSKSNAGIFPADSHLTYDLIKSLTAWAHNNNGENQSVVLLIDDLEPLVTKNHPIESQLRWLLSQGPTRRVWTIATTNSVRISIISEWLELFHTRIYGFIGDEIISRNLSGSTNPFPARLNPGWQFAMRESKRWLRFWIPSLE